MWLLLENLSRRPPLIDKHISGTCQRTGSTVKVVTVAHLSDITAVVPIPNDAPAQDGVARPVIKGHTFEGAVVNVMVEHGIRQLERLHLALWIPDAQIGVLARENNTLLRKTVELGGVGAANSHEVLDGNFAIQDTLEQQRLPRF